MISLLLIFEMLKLRIKGEFRYLSIVCVKPSAYLLRESVEREDAAVRVSEHVPQSDIPNTPYGPEGLSAPFQD